MNVSVELSTGIFSGFVWSEDDGWIDFTNVRASSPLLLSDTGINAGFLLLGVGVLIMLPLSRCKFS